MVQTFQARQYQVATTPEESVSTSSFRATDRSPFQLEHVRDRLTGSLIQETDTTKARGPKLVYRHEDTLRIERELKPDMNHLATRYGVDVELRAKAPDARVEKFMDMREEAKSETDPAKKQLLQDKVDAVIKAEKESAARMGIKTTYFLTALEAAEQRLYGTNLDPDAKHTFSSSDLHRDIESFQRLRSVAGSAKELDKLRDTITEKFAQLDEHESLRLCQNLRKLDKAYRDAGFQQCAESVVTEFLPKAEARLGEAYQKDKSIKSASYVDKVTEYKHQQALVRYLDENKVTIKAGGNPISPSIDPSLATFGKNAELFNEFKKAGADITKLGPNFQAQLLANNPDGLNREWLQSLKQLAKNQDDPKTAERWIQSFEKAYSKACVSTEAIQGALALTATPEDRKRLRENIKSHIPKETHGYEQTAKTILINEVIEKHNRSYPAQSITPLEVAADQSVFLANHKLMKEFGANNGDLSKLGPNFLTRLVINNPNGLDPTWLKQIETLAAERGGDKPKLVEDLKRAYEAASINAEVLKGVMESGLNDDVKNQVIGRASSAITDLPYKERLTALKAIDATSNPGGRLGQFENLLNDPVHATYLQGNRIVAEFGEISNLNESDRNVALLRLKEEIRLFAVTRADFATAWLTELKSYAADRGISSQFSNFVNFYNESLKR
jgi:hypothetical protein